VQVRRKACLAGRRGIRPERIFIGVVAKIIAKGGARSFSGCYGFRNSAYFDPRGILVLSNQNGGDVTRDGLQSGVRDAHGVQCVPRAE
jgi:hypothetical protein